MANRLSREARIEVRERLPISGEDAKVDIQSDRISPEWEKYEQEERVYQFGVVIAGGWKYRVENTERYQCNTPLRHLSIVSYLVGVDGSKFSTT